jgi:hypothetical protein
MIENDLQRASTPTDTASHPSFNDLTIVSELHRAEVSTGEIPSE